MPGLLTKTKNFPVDDARLKAPSGRKNGLRNKPGVSGERPRPADIPNFKRPWRGPIQIKFLSQQADGRSGVGLLPGAGYLSNTVAIEPFVEPALANIIEQTNQIIKALRLDSVIVHPKLARLVHIGLQFG